MNNTSTFGRVPPCRAHTLTGPVPTAEDQQRRDADAAVREIRARITTQLASLTLRQLQLVEAYTHEVTEIRR